MMDEDARRDIVNYRCRKARELMHDVDVLDLGVGSLGASLSRG